MALGNDQLTQSIVALVHDGKILGTGFFIGNDGSLLTCAHVVKGQGTVEIPEKELTITFHEQEYPVEYLYIHPYLDVLDVAILRVFEKKLPPEALLLPLGKWEFISGQRHRFRTFGFRTPDYFHGLYAAGEIRGRVDITESNALLLHLEPEEAGAQEIRPGMSGAPVYDEDSDQIVGMITLFFKQGEKETIPFAVPVEEIGEVWPPIKARLLEEEILQQFSKVFRIGEWFTERTLQSFYESLPLSNLVKYSELEENKSKALLDQIRLNAQGRIYDLINWIRSKRPDIPLAKLVELPPVHRINFVNREDELQEACDRYAVPYILFEAPAGYGKTELLKAIEQRHFRDGWVCIYVETSQDTPSTINLTNQIALQVGYSDPSSLPDARAVGYTLAGFLKSRVNSLDAPGVILLIDGVERLPEDEIDAFLNHFLIALRSVLQRIKLRVRLAGRYVGSSWEKQAREFEMTVKPLTPFRFRYVRDTVKSLLPSHPDPDLCAAHLMHITGGHPGCMAKIIELMNAKQPVEEHFEIHQKRYKDIVLSVAHEIRESIPDSLRHVFDVLSVFRRYNYRLLQKILDAHLIKFTGGADSLEKSLTATYLVKRKRGFIQDEIVRRLLAIRLRWEEPDRFINLCNKAKEIYAQDLQSTGSRPEFIALEGLYQELQSKYYQGKQTLAEREALNTAFFADDGVLHRYVKMLLTKPDTPDIIANFMALLEDEDEMWEFQFAVNFFLRGKNHYTNQAYEHMLHQIRTFFAQKGGK